MLDRVLIFELKDQAQKRLEHALYAYGVRQVDLATSTREVIMAVDKRPYDLLILPVEHGPHLLRPVRALNPGCPILLTTASAEYALPAGGADFQGVLFLSRLESDLPRFLEHIGPPPTETAAPASPASQLVSQEDFEEMCRRAELGQEVRQVIFSRAARVLVCGGARDGGADVGGAFAEQTAAQVHDNWDGGQYKTQIQYWQRPGSRENLLLYTRPVGTALMTMVADPQASISELRLGTERLLNQLARASTTRTRPAATGPVRASAVERGSVPSIAGPSAVAAAGDIATAASEKGTTRPAIRATGGRASAVFGALIFLLRHVAFGLLVLLVLVVVTYFGLNAARGMDAGQAATIAVEDSVQYIGRLLQGDLGMTTAGSNSIVAVPVSEVIVERLPRSLALMGISLLGATIVGLILGISAARRGSRRSLGIIMATIIGISIPSFFAAYLLQLVVITLTQKTGRSWLPVGGWGWDSHLVLPVLVLGARPLAQITRVTFVSIRDVLDQDYIRTAYSKGLRRVQIMGRHVMRNAAIPILVTVGVSLSFILGSLPVVELYFGIPGVGFTLLGAIAGQDDDLAVALLLCLGTLFLLVQFLLDLSNRLVDPRSAVTPDHLAAGKGSVAAFKSMVDDVGDYITDNALTQWVKRRLGSADAAVGPSLAKTESQSERIEIAAQPSTHRAGWAAAYRNAPLVAGALLMLVILAVVLFGAYLSPHSPYATQGLEIKGGEFSVPPFAPDAQYPWGTDVLGRDLASLILSGAQLTLTLALLVVVARMGFGIVLGAIAGWRSESWFDRLVMGTAEIIAAYPNVLLAMLIILALGIRQGMWPFVVGLGFVGWGDTMRFVRGEVTSIRPRAFIESAIAIGARTPRIIFKHIMPNLFSPLIALFALEMGAVLMLLGELGFLSIFVGGGAFYQLDTFAAPFHYSDVPEWGALLSNLRTYARSYPWLAIYPTMAFFISILAFNLFGEGIRRLVDDGSIIINRLVNRYTLALAAIGIVVFIWFRANSGPVAFYRQDARDFSGQLAEASVVDLTDPAFEGRALGSAGMDAAANYIADQFEALGLQPAGEGLTFFQERFRSFGTLEGMPELRIDDDGSVPVYGQDFAAYPGRFIPTGTMTGPIRYIGLGEALPIRGFSNQRYRALRTADFSDEILLALSEREAAELSSVPHGGLLVVVDDPAILERRITLPGRKQVSLNPFTGITEEDEGSPSLWITEEIANRILAGTGKTAADWRVEAEQLEMGQINEVSLDVQADMIVHGALEERWPVQNVIGHMPGLAATPGEAQMDDQVIFVLAQYDSPPTGPGGIFEAANDNASGVAVMLEAIRVMQETEYQPNRTFLFVAYSGEGLEGGESVSNPEISRFLQAKVGFATSLKPEAVIHVRAVGSGSGDALEVSAGGSLRLVELFESAAHKMGADIKRRDDPIDISVIYDEGSPYETGQDAPELRLSWQGWNEDARLASDTVDTISTGKLQDAGRTLALALMIMGRERQY